MLQVSGTCLLPRIPDIIAWETGQPRRLITLVLEECQDRVANLSIAWVIVLLSVLITLINVTYFIVLLIITNVIRFIVFVCCRVAEFQADNKMSAANLAQIFGRILMNVDKVSTVISVYLLWLFKFNITECNGFQLLHRSVLNQIDFIGFDLSIIHKSLLFINQLTIESQVIEWWSHWN